MLSQPLRLSRLLLVLAASSSALLAGCSSGTPLMVIDNDMVLAPTDSGNPVSVGGDGGGQVGAPCAQQQDCASGLCLLGEAYPDGLCALPCPSGGCPALSRCVPTQVALDGGAGSGFVQQSLCLPACGEDADCRSGYSCSMQGLCQ